MLHFCNMPRWAQNFPDLAALNCEAGIDLAVWQCSGCGLVQLSHEPVPYYKDVIRAAAVSDVVKEFKKEQFAQYVQKYNLEGKKVIEIGCGRGEFLQLLSAFNVEAHGMEHAALSVEYCRTQGLNVVQGYMDNERYWLPEGPYDAFFLLMFLEHMPDPNAVLKGIANNLTDGAVGLIEVPNFDMILRKNIFSEFIGDHLSYFSQDTLRTTLHLNGFDMIECDETRDEYVLSAVVRKRSLVDVSGFSDCQEKIKQEINLYIERFSPGQVAVWGAGHQALAILAVMKLESKIKYVVDSATFKQGKFTPATHVPVVAPDMLCIDPVQAVIVMAASYSDEVADILRERHGRQIHIAILREFGLEIVNE